jgi:hypothetical protein
VKAWQGVSARLSTREWPSSVQDTSILSSRDGTFVEQALDDYNIFAGRVWVVILIWITVAPYVFYQMQQ